MLEDGTKSARLEEENQALRQNVTDLEEKIQSLSQTMKSNDEKQQNKLDQVLALLGENKGNGYRTPQLDDIGKRGREELRKSNERQVRQRFSEDELIGFRQPHMDDWSDANDTGKCGTYD